MFLIAAWCLSIFCVNDSFSGISVPGWPIINCLRYSDKTVMKNWSFFIVKSHLEL